MACLSTICYSCMHAGALQIVDPTGQPTSAWGPRMLLARLMWSDPDIKVRQHPSSTLGSHSRWFIQSHEVIHGLTWLPMLHHTSLSSCTGSVDIALQVDIKPAHERKQLAEDAERFLSNTYVMHLGM